MNWIWILVAVLLLGKKGTATTPGAAAAAGNSTQQLGQGLNSLLAGFSNSLQNALKGSSGSSKGSGGGSGSGSGSGGGSRGNSGSSLNNPNGSSMDDLEIIPLDPNSGIMSDAVTQGIIQDAFNNDPTLGNPTLDGVVGGLPSDVTDSLTPDLGALVAPDPVTVLGPDTATDVPPVDTGTFDNSGDSFIVPFAGGGGDSVGGGLEFDSSGDPGQDFSNF